VSGTCISWEYGFPIKFQPFLITTVKLSSVNSFKESREKPVSKESF
jgi:hypothetical protein